MKKVIILLLFSSLSLCFAQRPNGQGRNNSGFSSQSQEIPKFESEKIAGIFEYNSKKVLKKLKLKKNDTISTSIMDQLDNYNLEISKIKTENKALFEGLDIVVNQNIETARQNRNRELMKETMLMVRERLQPVIEQIEVQETTLNQNLKSLITDEQNDKWLDYQKSEKQKLLPKRGSNDARNRPDDITRQRRRRG